MLLAHLGTAMTATGQPIHEVEADLGRVAERLGYPDTQVAAAPTGITVCLGSGQPSTFEALNGPLRLDQAADVVVIRYRLSTGSISSGQALGLLAELRAKPPRYPRWVRYPGWVLVSAGITLILQPGGPNVAVAAVSGLVVAGLVRLAEGRQLIATLLPTLAAFVAGCLVFGAAGLGWIDGPLRTLLPPLAVLLPGATLVTGISELAAGAMVAGTSRLVYGSVQLLLFALGVIAAARVIGTPAPELGNIAVHQLGPWAPVLGLMMIGLGVCLLESAAFALMPWILGVLVLAFAAQSLGQHFGGAAVGPFLGAVAATLGSRLAELIRPTLPRLVVFLPSFWLLVPGSLGLLGVSQLGLDPTNATTVAFGAVTVIVSIALGLIVGATIARGFAGMIRRSRHRRGVHPDLPVEPS